MTAKGFEVEITSAAQQDLENLHEYLTAEGAGDAADRLVVKLLEAAASLEDFALRGSPVAEMDAAAGDDVRQLLVGTRRVIYLVEGQEVLVFLVVDGRRDFGPILRQRLGLP